jgi:O-antigen/teichoic acid export membrane protein
MVTGSGWMVSLRVVDRLIGLASIAILARLLLPEQFGIVNMAVMLIGLLEMVSEFNVRAALISEPHATRQHFDTAWTLNIVRGILLSATLLLLAEPAASFLREPAVAGVAYWLALAPLLGSLENIGVVYFQKELNFHREFVFILTARVIATVVTIVLAWRWADYWALVAGMITRTGVRVLLSYVMHDFRPRFSLQRFLEIFNFSKWMFVQHLVAGVNDRLPGLAVARIAGAETLALLNVAHEIAHLATSELRAPVRRVMFPGFAKMASDRQQMVTTFKDAFGIMLLLALPIPIGIGLTASHLIRLFLGPHWMGAAPVLQVLAIFGVIMTLGTSSHVIYLATKRPRITVMFALLKLCVLLPLLWWWVPLYGAVGAAWSVVVAASVNTAVDYVVILRLLHVHILELLRITWRTLVAAGVMAAVVASAMPHFATAASVGVVALQFGSSVAMGIVTYLLALALLWITTGKPVGPETQILGTILRSRRDQ